MLLEHRRPLSTPLGGTSHDKSSGMSYASLSFMQLLDR
jgi:hypothetical protein